MPCLRTWLTPNNESFDYDLETLDGMAVVFLNDGNRHYSRKRGFVVAVKRRPKFRQPGRLQAGTMEFLKRAGVPGGLGKLPGCAAA